MNFRWNEVIRTSKYTRNRMNRVVNSQRVKVFSELVKNVQDTDSFLWKLATEIYWMTLDGVATDAPGLHEFVGEASPHVRRLSIRSIKGGEIQPTLKQLPLLEVLEIFDEVKFSSPEPIVLKNLKCLKINQACVDILEKIKVTEKIFEFSITDLQMDGKIAKVAQFLKHCPALEKLTVWILLESPLFPSEMFAAGGLSENLPFRLKYLNMRGFYALETEPTISKFLKLHAETLEHLDLQAQEGLMGFELCQQILTSFPNLKTLKVNGRSFSDDKSFFVGLNAFPKITDLTVMGDLHKSSKEFFALFPSLKRLTVDPYLRYFPNFLVALKNHHPNLQYLSFSSFRAGSPHAIEFTNLKHLVVNEIHHPPALMPFLMTHRQLRSIRIGDMAAVTDENISVIMDLPLLRNLELQAKKQEVIKRAFDLIKQDYKSLQYAKFSYRTGRYSEYLHQEIQFPLEKHFWNPQQYENFFAVE